MPIRLLAMLALARLLSPEQFGTYAVALAAVQLLGVLADIGTTQYLVKAPRLTEVKRRAAFGLGLALGAGAALPLVAVGVAAPAWIGQGVGPVLAVQAGTLLVQPAVAVLAAGLQRDLRFGPVAIAWVAGAAAFAAVATALAWAGIGPVALAIGGVAELLVVAGLLMRHQRLPRPALLGWRSVFRFGWVWGAIHGLRQGAESLSRLITGWVLGLGPLGVLSRAQALVQIFDKALLDALQPVVLPALSAAQRAGRPIGPVYLRQVACLAAFAWPFFGGLALLAEPAVRLLLGPGWDAAVPVLRWLCLAGLFLPVASLTLPYLVAVGRLADWLPIQVWLQVGRVAATAGAAFVSVEAVAAALALENGIKALLAQRLLARHMGLGWREMAAVLGRSALPAGMALAAMAVVARPEVLGGAAGWVLLPAAALAACLAWLPALMLVRHPLHAEFGRLRALLPAGGRRGLVVTEAAGESR